MKKAVNYLYLNIADFVLEVIKTDPSETKQWLLNLCDAVVKCQKGVSTYSDKIIEEMEAFRQKSAERQKAYRERLMNVGATNTNNATKNAQKQPLKSEKTHSGRPDPIKDTFEFFRKMFGGRKGGLEIEYGRFRNACEKYGLKPSVEVTKLCDAWAAEDSARKEANANGTFYPEPKNLATWLNNLCWQQEQAKPNDKVQTNNLSQAQRLMIQMENNG